MQIQVWSNRHTSPHDYFVTNTDPQLNSAENNPNVMFGDADRLLKFPARRPHHYSLTVPPGFAHQFPNHSWVMCCSGFVHFFLFVSHTHSHISFFIEKRVAFIVKVTIFSPCTEASIVWWCRRSATQFLMWHSLHGHVEAQLHSLSSYCCHIGKPHLAHVLILLTC